MPGFLEMIEGAIEALPRVKLCVGEVLFRQGELSRHMYVVLGGRLKASIKGDDGQEILVGHIEAGHPVDEMQVFTGGKRTATVVALEDTELVALPAEQIDRLKKDAPAFYEALERLIFQRFRRNHLLMLLPELFGEMDEAAFTELENILEWRDLKKGERLIRQGDAGDAMYIVLSGRLNVVVEDEAGNEKVSIPQAARARDPRHHAPAANGYRNRSVES